MRKDNNENDYTKLYEKAIELWGQDAQIDMMIEECSELIKALLKYRRNDSKNKVNFLIDNIQDELADVSIMVEQMIIIFGDITDVKKSKLRRLRERLKNHDASNHKGVL